MSQRDIFFGKLIRLLAELDLEMHTPKRGETWTCKRRPKHARRFALSPSAEKEGN